MQIATIEFARNACGLKGAHSEEFKEECEHPVIHLLEDQKTVTKKGASMRLGLWDTKLKAGSKVRALYDTETVSERHRHRYEFNQDYRDQFEKAGFVLAGTSPDGELGEIVEIPDHPFFVAVQFHPEFLSKPTAPHPLFRGFVEAALKVRKQEI